MACCEGEQPHHLVESHCFCEEGKKGTALKQFKGKGKSKGYNPKDAPCVCAFGDRFTGEHGSLHAFQGRKETSCVTKATNKEYAWTYQEAKSAGVKAHKKVFPNSHCSEGCLNAQLDAYHNDINVNDDTPIRSYDASKNLQEWQKKSSDKSIISEMNKQLGKSLSKK